MKMWRRGLICRNLSTGDRDEAEPVRRWLATPNRSLVRAASRYRSLSPLETGSTRGSIFVVPAASRLPSISGGGHAGNDRAVLWVRRSPGNSCRVPSDWRARCSPDQGGANVPHDDSGAGSVTRLVEGGGGDPRRRGEHRSLLAPGLCGAGRSFELIVGNA